jgi:hypothetical protein
MIDNYRGAAGNAKQEPTSWRWRYTSDKQTLLDAVETGNDCYRFKNSPTSGNKKTKTKKTTTD